MQPSSRYILFNDLVEAGLVDRDNTFVEIIKFFEDSVNSCQVDPKFGKTGTCDQSKISGANNCYMHNTKV